MRLMNYVSKLAALCLFALCATASSGADDHIYIAHGDKTGYPYESNVDTPGGEYFALVCRDTCFLKKVSLSVTDAQVEGYDGATAGHVVKVLDDERSMFLIKGMNNLHEGLVKTWYFNGKFQKSIEIVSDSDYSKGQLASWKIDDKVLTISSTVTQLKESSCEANDADCQKYPQVKWKFRFGDIERTLVTLGGKNELENPLVRIDDFLVWVGDIDGDGKPDLVVRPQDRSDYLELSIYLSSTLTPGKPWRSSAKFYWWDPKNPGC
jgi:hypothetical protein